MIGREISILVSISHPPKNSRPLNGSSKNARRNKADQERNPLDQNPLKGKKYHEECFSAAWQIRRNAMLYCIFFASFHTPTSS